MSWGKGGWGGGWTKGSWGGKAGWSKPPALPDGFEVDPGRIFIGTTITYYTFQGYGFIVPDETGIIPNDKVFVHWKQLKSTDRYPALVKDSKVQFTLVQVEKNGVTTLQADNVCAPGGLPLATQDAADAKKTFVGGQNLRYTGLLKFFLPSRGFGYIKIDPGFQYDREGVPEEIRVETVEMNCGGGNPPYMENVQVEFGIWMTTRGAFKGYHVTLPGGLALPAADGATS